MLEQIISTNDKGSYIFAPLINVHSLVEKNEKVYPESRIVLAPECIQGDQQVLRKRKTELGGTCSMASLTLFTGLLTV